MRTGNALKRAARGGWIGRKFVPRDVADEYKKLYGLTEERFVCDPIDATKARAKHREWLSEIEARIANIRAERTGSGRTLSPMQARALAGEWYAWFLDYMTAQRWQKDVLAAYRDRQWQGLCSVAEGFGTDPLDHADQNYVRPVIADEGKTAQFLSAKRIILDQPSRDLFVDHVSRDFFPALERLLSQAEGDYDEDNYAKRFPKLEVIGDTSLTLWGLFERWVRTAKPAASTINRWRAVFQKLHIDFPNTNAGGLLPEQAHEWSKELVNDERSAATVRDVWVNAGRAVYTWGIGEKLVSRNPFTGWRLTVPRKKRNRESQAFNEDEVKTILKAALSTTVHSKMDAAKRWVPWLCGYTGARPGEITQLRDADVFSDKGIWAIRITPEAGSVKSGNTRTVPLHSHLIDLGFIDFVKASGKGALFYNEAPARRSESDDPTNPKRPRSVKTRERLAQWVRDVGIKDPEVKPNHAWRHTFKKIGRRFDISEHMLDAICGHTQVSTGRSYGNPDLADKAQALEKFPCFEI
jgi:integrase